MPKVRLSCRDCGFSEYAAGVPVCLCWRPYDGPQVVRAEGGLCGYEAPLGKGRPRDLWRALHKRTQRELVEIVGLLRLAGANVTEEARKEAEP